MTSANQDGHPVARHLGSVLEAAPEGRAVLYEDTWWTWGDLNHVARSLQDALARVPVPDGAAVALVMLNRPASIAALVSLLSSGHPPVLISPIQPPAALTTMIRAASFDTVVVESSDWNEQLETAVSDAGSAGIELAATNLTASIRVARAIGGTERYSVGPETALVVPTSGTTGAPKLIDVPWSALPVDTDRPVTAEALEADRPPIIHALSSATITGCMALISAIGRGRSVATMDRVDVERWADLVKRFRPRRAGLPPAAMQTILDKKISPDHFASLRAWVTGSARLDPDLQEEFERAYQLPVLVAYGATEFAGAVAGWTLEDHERWIEQKRGSVGRALPGIQIRVVDAESGEPLMAGETGTLEVLPSRRAGGGEGWMRTNDLARIDADGFLFIEGRTDDVIVRGGFKVSLAEVEDLFRSHPDVEDVVAMGLPDSRLGEVPGALVVLRTGAAVTAGDLQDWLRVRAAPYKVPTSIAFADALPMTGSHKVSRALAREVVSRGVVRP